MVDASAESCASAFLTGWISRFGVPTTITSDQGQQFESDLWHSLMNLRGATATRLRITAYHPQANGLVGRFNRHLKMGLKARRASSNWVDDLPIVLLGIRATLKEDLSCTSAELVYDTILCLPGDFFSPPVIEDPSSFVSRLRSSMQHLPFVPTRWNGRHAVYLLPDLQTATHVYVRRDSHKPPLTRPYDGPFPVLRCFDRNFTLNINGKTKEVTVDRLKPAKFIGDSGAVDLPAAVSAPHSPTLPAHRENTSAPHQVPSPPSTTTREGRLSRRPAHLSDYL